MWEPRPPSCIPENYDAILEAVKLADVFSPNHIEIAQIFGNQSPEVLDRSILEEYATKILASGVGQTNSGTVIIRAGEAGCLVASTQRPFAWLPPFYKHLTEEGVNDQDGPQESKVIDPTGAGNAFLGAFTIGLLKTGNPMEAACYGNVGASFALEQTGLPNLDISDTGVELWNGVEVESRLRTYRLRHGL